MLQYSRSFAPSFQSSDDLVWYKSDVIALLSIIVNKTLPTEKPVSERY